ncbi:hypothetical protein CYY_009928 [Polysphondylium violaceum]|uniref:Prefoldin subunit 1 n=1 Tax=Polysphondylium violaceum TaxID=133409 RepID=A0A8J4V051_9MYCE|nr:hypothetical protein CYY_009928 [Polysphondylium violaceum]
MADYEITDKKAFQETREKLFTLTRSLNACRQRIQITDTDKQRCLITTRELESLPSNTKTYKAVGKMFIISPMNELKDELNKQAQKDEEDVKGLINQSKYLDAQIRDAEKSLQELVIMKK